MSICTKVSCRALVVSRLLVGRLQQEVLGLDDAAERELLLARVDDRDLARRGRGGGGERHGRHDDANGADRPAQPACGANGRGSELDASHARGKKSQGATRPRAPCLRWDRGVGSACLGLKPGFRSDRPF
jgi:hypothetical protein